MADSIETKDASIVTVDGEVRPLHAPAVVHAGNPLDMPIAAFQAGLERRGQNRVALIHWVREALVDGVDFGRIKTKHGMSKPSLYKPGAEKICGMLGVTAVFPNLVEYEQRVLEGFAIDALLIRCELVNSSGEIVASGAGARSVGQDQGDLNKALKMCLKSAMIDATLRLGGLSEVFTQDIEDMPRETIGQPGAPAEAVDPSLVPRGKHKGRPWAEVSDDYIQWCTETETTIPADLRRGAEAELERRIAGVSDQDAGAGRDFDNDVPF